MRIIFGLVTITLTAIPCMAQVTITNLAIVASTSTSATVAWNTSGPASTQVIFSLNPANLNSSTVKVPTLVTSHSASLTGLTGLAPYTPIYYAAVSIDGSNHTTTSSTQSFELCSATNPATSLTNLSGNINNYYEYGAYSITWINNSGQAVSPTICGSPLTTTVTGNLDSASSFNIGIPDNLQIVPSPSQWQITFNSVGGIGSVTASPITITGPSQNISSTLSAAAFGHTIHVWFDQFTGIFYPPITGTGTVTSVGLGAPTGFPVTGSPITGGGTLAFAMPSGWTTGDILLGNGANSVSRLPIGTNGKCPVSNGTTLTYQSCGTPITFQTNSVNNSSQTTLNLTAGSGITLTSGSSGLVTIANTSTLAFPLLSTSAGTVTVPAFSFQSAPDSGIYFRTTPATYAITAASRASNVVSLTIPTLPVGNDVVITGESAHVAGMTDSSYNGDFSPITVSGTTITYAQTGANSSSSGGTFSPWGTGIGGYAQYFQHLASTSTSASSVGALRFGPTDAVTYGCPSCTNSTVTGLSTTDQNLISGASNTAPVNVGDYLGISVAGPILDLNSALYIDTTIPSGAMAACPAGATHSCFGVSSDGHFYAADNGGAPLRIGNVISLFGLTGAIGNLTGDVTTSGSTATSIAAIQGTAVGGTTGSGNVVFGTNPSLGGNVDIGTAGLIDKQIANNSSGTSINLLTKYATGSSAQVVTTATTDVIGIVGICVGVCSTTGTAKIAILGKASCIFDGSTTNGDWVVNSPTVPGNCHDSGIAPPACPGGYQLIGRVGSTNGAGGMYSVNLSGPDTLCGSPVASANIVPAYCNGVIGTANATAYPLAPFIAANSNNCQQTTNVEMIMPVTCTASGLYAKATAAGGASGSGFVQLYKNTVAQTFNCTLGTGTSCTDLTDTVSFTAGDTYKIMVTTGQATDTTATVRASFTCK